MTHYLASLACVLVPLWSAVALGGCRQKNATKPIKPLSIAELQISNATRLLARQAGLSSKQLEQPFRQSLQKSGLFRLPNKDAKSSNPSRTGYRCRLEIHVLMVPVRADAGKKPASFKLEVASSITLTSLFSKDEPIVAEEHLFRNHPLRRPSPAFLQKLILKAMKQTVKALALQVQIAHEAPAALIRSLKNPREEARIQAARRLGEQRYRPAVPALIRSLKDPSRPVVLAAVGALVKIGDPRAAPPFIRLARGKSPAFVSQILYALASIGGEKAENYLSTLSTGHPNPFVRKSATEALAELHQKQKKKGSLND